MNIHKKKFSRNHIWMQYFLSDDNLKNVYEFALRYCMMTNVFFKQSNIIIARWHNLQVKRNHILFKYTILIIIFNILN